MELLRLVALNIAKPVNNPAAHLEVGRTLLEPTPSLQSAGTDLPAPREFNLVQVL
jgi:hypothetical protein